MSETPPDRPKRIIDRRTSPTDPQPEHTWGPPTDQSPGPQFTAPAAWEAPQPGMNPSPEQPPPPDVPLRKEVEHPHPLTGVARSWIALFGLVFIFGRDVAERGLSSLTEMSPFLWVILGLVVTVVLFNLVWGIIEWRTTTFVVDDEEFRIERDFLSRDSSRIAYTKIQSVDIERSLPARVLGLSSVTIDVGGAGGKKLEFLGKQRAEVLRDQLLARMQRHAEAPKRSEEISTSLHPDLPTGLAPTPAHTVVTVRPSTLLKGVFVSSFLPWFVAGLAALGFLIAFDEGFSFAALGGVIFGLGGYLWSQVVTNWNFQMDKVPDGLHMTRGLFTTTSQSLKADRIQAVSVHQDYLQRLTGLYRVRVTVLGLSGGEGGQTSSLVLPYGTREDVSRVLAAFWPGIELDSIELHSQPARARWLTPLGFRRHQWGVDDQTVVAHHGWLDHTVTLVPHRRMQSIEITQGPWQRRLRLARVYLHTTDGPVSMNLYHLDVVEARQFFNEQILRARTARSSPGEPGYLSALPAPSVDELIPAHETSWNLGS
ncbi:MAG: PH domain-containing protein [Arachnia sp.]